MADHVLPPADLQDVLERLIDQRLFEVMRTESLGSPRRRMRRNWVESTLWVREYKAYLGCLFCVEHDPACLDLHHRPGTTKVAAVAQMISDSAPVIAIIAEVRKCDVVCANCHRKAHHRSRASQPPLLPRRGPYG